MPILHQSAVIHPRNVLCDPIRNGIVLELLETSRGADDEDLHIESFPIRAKRLECAYSLLELTHGSLLVSRGNVVHADCDVYQRLEEIAFRAASAGPCIFKQIMTFEVQLAVEQLYRLGEEIFVGQ